MSSTVIRDFYDLQSDPPISPGPAGALRSHYGSIGCVPCVVLHIPVAVFIPGSLYFLIPPPSPAAPQTRFSFDGHFVFSLALCFPLRTRSASCAPSVCRWTPVAPLSWLS